ncbi:MAG: hypothetical protein K0S32_1348 [Bacteroidetes bacterium]|jgi:hypothetical protein|nr:hypothetical protein [Bacteroidota bacterium]
MTRYFALVLLLYISQNIFSQTQSFDERTGIEINFSAEGKIFPESWYSAKIDAKGGSLSEKEFTRSKEVVTKALSKYPVDVIKTNLKAVYVLDSIIFFGVPYGGTNSNNKIYLGNRGENKGYTDHYIEQAFHEEFSSILLRNKPLYLDKARWQSNNARSFTYGTGGVNAIKQNKDGLIFDSTFHKIGLLSEYSASDLENDFNSFARNLFEPKPGFRELLEKYEGIRNKRKLTIEFYHKINETFTEEFFDKILYSRN